MQEGSLRINFLRWINGESLSGAEQTALFNEMERLVRRGALSGSEISRELSFVCEGMLRDGKSAAQLREDGEQVLPGEIRVERDDLPPELLTFVRRLYASRSRLFYQRAVRDPHCSFSGAYAVEEVIHWMKQELSLLAAENPAADWESARMERLLGERIDEGFVRMVGELCPDHPYFRARRRSWMSKDWPSSALPVNLRQFFVGQRIREQGFAACADLPFPLPSLRGTSFVRLPGFGGRDGVILSGDAEGRRRFFAADEKRSARYLRRRGRLLEVVGDFSAFLLEKALPRAEGPDLASAIRSGNRRYLAPVRERMRQLGVEDLWLLNPGILYFGPGCAVLISPAFSQQVRVILLGGESRVFVRENSQTHERTIFLQTFTPGGDLAIPVRALMSPLVSLQGRGSEELLSDLLAHTGEQAALVQEDLDRFFLAYPEGAWTRAELIAFLASQQSLRAQLGSDAALRTHVVERNRQIEEEMRRLSDESADLRRRRASLGFFHGKEKQALVQQIDARTARIHELQREKIALSAGLPRRGEALSEPVEPQRGDERGTGTPEVGGAGAAGTGTGGTSAKSAGAGSAGTADDGVDFVPAAGRQKNRR